MLVLIFQVDDELDSKLSASIPTAHAFWPEEFAVATTVIANIAVKKINVRIFPYLSIYVVDAPKKLCQQHMEGLSR